MTNERTCPRKVQFKVLLSWER